MSDEIFQNKQNPADEKLNLPITTMVVQTLFVLDDGRDVTQVSRRNKRHMKHKLYKVQIPKGEKNQAYQSFQWV